VGVDDVVEIVSPLEHVGVHAVGENAAVAPEGSPEAEKATRSEERRAGEERRVWATEAPWLTDLPPPFVSAKLKEVVAGFTVRLELVVLVTPAPAVVTVVV